ncbi:TRAP transporter substrate-binding protein [Sneathiella limimaris]|uniref:TRAP transporter substrate-binding protein n=1 Tax=Sneathiella limimaris TaxID=1964213 RepID=UPI00146B7761|nr:TRAP transporter substrate-binding protein DctP [Sneathiella limimaris]
MGRMFFLIFLMVFTVGGSSVRAETEIRFSTAAPEKTPWAIYAHQIAESVKKDTSGTIKVQVFSGSQLGNEQDVIRQVARGRIHMGSFSNTAASLMVPEIALLAAPYIWDSLEQADCALDNHLFSIFQNKFEEKGLIILGWTEVGNRGYAFTSPVNGLADLAGKKMRVAPTKASSLTADGFGANAVVLPITEVASALQTGLVEGADLPGLVYTALGFSKIAPNWIASNHSHQVGMVLMSQKVWKRLSDEQQSAFLKARQSPVKLRQMVRGAEKSSLAKFSENGGRVIELNADQMANWRRTAKAARDSLIEDLGGDAKPIYAQIEEAKRACTN